jgi:hypothetical protein
VWRGLQISQASCGESEKVVENGESGGAALIETTGNTTEGVEESLGLLD